jgi:hypothetical protein
MFHVGRRAEKGVNGVARDVLRAVGATQEACRWHDDHFVALRAFIL